MLHQNNPTHLSRVFCFGGRYRTRTARAERSEGNQSPSGALISARFPTRRNVYRDDRRFVVGGTGLEQQRRRPPPAAETGSRGWDSVLIFQSPAKGLRKNQQTQPVQVPAVRFRQGSQRLGMSTKKDAARPFGLGTFFVVDGTGREPERAKAGYHYGSILPFALICFISRSQHPLQYSLRENSP